MRRVLMVSPHFPPDTGAATHRVRLLAPHLTKYGWEPTVLTLEPTSYEGRLDPELMELVPTVLRVVRCRAWNPRWTRRLGFGDLGLRAFWGLYRTCVQLLNQENFDVLFITILPGYPALLGPIMHRKVGIPYVLDYQDPWVSAWGLAVGSGPNGEADLKSRASRWIATQLEPIALRHAAAITAVSAGTYEQIVARMPEIVDVPRAAIPVGGEPGDLEYLRRRPRCNPFFDPTDGLFHLCYVGTLLPLGFETLRAVLKAVRLLRDRKPDIYRLLRLHFFGTSNQTTADAPCRVVPLAREIGVDESVTEVAYRIDYLDALTVQCQASAILLMGSSEPHYTASKLYPALLAQRPILAVFHTASSVIEVLQKRSTTANIVIYDSKIRPESQCPKIYEQLSAVIALKSAPIPIVEEDALAGFSCQSLARDLGAIFDRIFLNGAAS